MQAKLKVSRYDPETMGRGQQRWDEFELDVHPNATVLDALIQIREEVDGTLALRCACRASICGSCGMRVNGDAKLVCKTRIADIGEEGATIVVEPMGNQAVIKDLVVTLDTFFDKVRQVDPYLQPDTVPEQGEYMASDESMVNLLTAMNCIMCGACVSDCTVLEVDEAFIGPAALAKAWRFVEDPRDDQRDARLEELNDVEGGIWDCTRCFKCVEVCPKDVAPMDRIMEMRDMAIEAGNTNTSGYRHTESFNKSVKKHGRLDEARLAVESAGYTNVPRLIDLAEIGVKSVLKGKMPPIVPHKADEKEKITRIFEKVESERGS